MRPTDLAQQPTCHPCSQMGWLHGWTQTQRDLGTRRSRCSPGSRGTGGHSQRGHVAGRAAHRTPAAPAAGPPCPLECRSPSPGGCLGQMQGKEVRSEEREDDSCLGLTPCRPQRPPVLPDRLVGASFPHVASRQFLFRLEAYAVGSITPCPPGPKTSFHVQMHKARPPCALPTAAFPSGLFADFLAPPTRAAPAFSPSIL